eukprot:1291002-Ditylum_brightwellii.AAC.1
MSSSTANIDSETNNNDHETEGTAHTSTAATTSTTNAPETIQQSSVNVFTYDIQYIGIDNLAKATVAAEK